MVLGDTLSQASDFMPLLLQTLEKAVAQNSQHALLAEGVAASVLLSRLAMLDTQPGEAVLSGVILISCQCFEEHRECESFCILFLQNQSSPAFGT